MVDILKLSQEVTRWELEMKLSLRRSFREYSFAFKNYVLAKMALRKALS